jgi:hypothetical protein
MRGHIALTKARKAGWEFPAIFVVDLPFTPPTQAFLDAENSLAMSLHPEVDLGPDDNPSLLDFRFAANLRVHVSGLDEQRVRAIMRRMKQFSPIEIVGAGFGDVILRWTPKQ